MIKHKKNRVRFFSFRFLMKSGSIAITLSITYIAALVILSIFGPLIVRRSYASMNFDMANRIWDLESLRQGYLLGTDYFGRDLFIRMCYGGRVSLFIALISTLIEGIFGPIYGGVAGYIGGTVDFIMMKIIEMVSGIPSLLYSILLVVILGPGVKTIIISMAISRWMTMALVVRSEVRKIKQKEFVQASELLGAKTPWILFKHLLPNSMNQILVRLVSSIPAAIFYEAFLSFIGIGIRPPFPSWGQMLFEGFGESSTTPHLFIIPAATVSLTVLSFNILGNRMKYILAPVNRG